MKARDAGDQKKKTTPDVPMGMNAAGPYGWGQDPWEQIDWNQYRPVIGYMGDKWKGKGSFDKRKAKGWIHGFNPYGKGSKGKGQGFKGSGKAKK